MQRALCLGFTRNRRLLSAARCASSSVIPVSGRRRFTWIPVLVPGESAPDDVSAHPERVERCGGRELCANLAASHRFHVNQRQQLGYVMRPRTVLPGAHHLVSLVARHVASLGGLRDVLIAATTGFTGNRGRACRERCGSRVFHAKPLCGAS